MNYNKDLNMIKYNNFYNQLSHLIIKQVQGIIRKSRRTRNPIESYFLVTTLTNIIIFFVLNDRILDCQLLVN